MEKDMLNINQGLQCEVKCVYEWVECIEEEDGAAICKTRERNCFNDCSRQEI